MIINGYASETGNMNDVTNPLGERQSSIPGPSRPTATVTTLPVWAELTCAGTTSRCC